VNQVTYLECLQKKEGGKMKQAICSAFGIVGSAFAALFGGWDAGLTTLLIFMGLDYVTGLMVAGVFKNSPKTDTGALESRAGWKGLCRKGMTLVFVLVATRLDLVIGTNYIRDAVIIAFIANELISLVENAGLMGVPLPDAITKAIDILQKKADKKDGE
jgi:toxin secretion/phage lysis holin